MNETVDILNQLLEAEKAGVLTLDYLIQQYREVQLPFQQIKVDEAWSTTGLIESIKIEGGVPSKNTGDFLKKIKAQAGLFDQLELLNRGQSWVVKKIYKCWKTAVLVIKPVTF